jgi:undecaprenyl-diphosphatase
VLLVGEPVPTSPEALYGLGTAREEGERMQTWHAVLLGLIEGLTEFIPVSSTAHILLAGNLLGAKSTGDTFPVVIQLGAVLAILTVYFAKLWRLLLDLPRDRRTQLFVGGILLAFLPAAMIGVLLHSVIKGILFQSPLLICSSLIIGGIILLIVDRMSFQPKHRDVMDFPPLLALKIGLCQCLAMIPGVSRSGATIVGAMLMGTDKRSAAEFSFFLAMPTMAGAFAYDLYKNWRVLSPDDVTSIVIGFVTAFVAGVVVVRYLLDFVSRYGFAPFAWWRIVVGGIGLGAVMILG